jgi:transcriptional regulatory protein RtcR
MPRRAQVIIGFYGTQLDGGKGPGRWQKWRPTLSLLQQPDLQVDRLELLISAAGGSPISAQVLLEDAAQVAPGLKVVAHPLPMKDPWDLEEVYEALLAWVRTQKLDAEREDYLVHITTGTHIMQICLFLLVESHFLPGRLLQSSPPSPERRAWSIIDLDLGRYDRIAQRFAAEAREATTFLKAGIETRNPTFNRMIERIEQVAVHSDAPILLLGPSGAGKSQLARRIHALKVQRKVLAGPLVEVNCATLRGDQASSTLFGHRKGAYTGASADREGLLRAAHKGMLFLDEIGELGLDEQAMLLRALEERRFLPLGADREVESDFRLIAGTNRDLRRRVAEGRFREDLLARIDLWTFRLPGLAERPEDIAPNLDHELELQAQRGGNRVTINREARDAFLAFARSPAARWRTNFRDLSAAVTRMATLAPQGRITLAEVDEEIGRLREAWGEEGEDPLAGLIGPETQLDHIDRVQLAEVVRVCCRSANMAEAGRVLFSAAAGRPSFNGTDRVRKLLARYDLDWERVTSRGAG